MENQETRQSYDLSRLTTQGEAATTSYIKIEENRKKEWGLYGRDTGIHDLNLAIGGILPTEVITLAGRSGMGKTAALTPFAWATERETETLTELCFFSWEMAPYKLVDRMITYKTGLTNRDLMVGARLLNETQMDKIKDTINRAKKVRAIYQESSIGAEQVCGYVEEFCKACKEKEQKDGLKRHPVIIIDFIGLADFDESGIRTHGIGDFYKRIKNTANKTGCSFIVLAQINRSSDNKDYPDRADLSDSQSIEQSSDVLVIVHRPEYMGKSEMRDPKTGEEISSRNKALFRVLKGRSFGIGDFVTECDIGKYRFWSMDHGKWNHPYYELYEKEDFWRQHFKLPKAEAPIEEMFSEA